MDTSRRAVESYWRSKMIDVATSDEDKVTPVYKLEEICELLRSSHVSIVKEVSEFILRRLQHKSPIVKQKALRVIKYAVGKSGVDFKREMQRNSVAIRGLIHHKGQPDPLKGDALNKSVRETAQEALSAIFAGEDANKPPPTEGLTRRIEGFGNTNFDKSSNGSNKSFLSEVVGIGSATIKQGLNSLTQTQTQSKNNMGGYRSPNLGRSLTNETSYSGSNESMSSSSLSTSQELKTSGNSCEKSREERLVDTIVTSGGVRLQPTRDALQVFLTEALKLDALALSHALGAKLQSHMWQVCVKALCVLEAILRKKDDEHFLMVASYFTENIDVVVECTESPQASVRERANKVLSVLNGDQKADKSLKTEKPVIQMPDLIDTNDQNENKNSIKSSSLATPTTSLIDDFFGGDDHNNQPGNNDDHDPFADVSFHAQNNEDEHESSNIFSEMATVDIFGVHEEEDHKDHVKDLMAVLSVYENKSPSPAIKISDSTTNGNPQMNDDLGNVLWSHAHGMTPNHMFPVDSNTYNAMAFAHDPVNYAAMSNFLAHQQFLSTMSPNIGHVSNSSGTQVVGSTSALPDIFNPVIASQAPASTMNASKKDETRAFDFISDHLRVGRDPKRVS